MSDIVYTVSSTPHNRSEETIESIMKHVLIALLPASIMGIIIFGQHAFWVILCSIATCVLAEYAYERILKKTITIKDYSAAVTGLLLALNLPPSVNLYVPIVGGIFAIIVVKQLFGGLGQNIVNPALAARALLLTSYPGEMTTFTLDGVSAATPLAHLKELSASSDVLTSATSSASPFTVGAQQYIDALIGNIGGCIGETCVFAIVIGGVYLLIKRIINWRIPVFYLGTVFILSFILGREDFFQGYPLYELITGGLLLGAFFMATDYTTSPVTPKGKIVMGIGCGIITVVIRRFGSYPEGVSYSILLMNLAVPLIDRYMRPRVFGTGKRKGAEA